MNGIITTGILMAAFVLMFVIATVLENIEAIGEWWFDIGTSYYKVKMRRSKKWR